MQLHAATALPRQRKCRYPFNISPDDPQYRSERLGDVRNPEKLSESEPSLFGPLQNLMVIAAFRDVTVVGINDGGSYAVNLVEAGPARFDILYRFASQGYRAES
jgi:hypothetical protein